MLNREVATVEVSDDWLRWAAGGVAAAAGATVLAVGRVFRGNVDGIRQEVHALEERTKAGMDDLWEVINTERDLASQQRERNYERLSKTPTREEMNGGFARLEALIREGKK